MSLEKFYSRPGHLIRRLNHLNVTSKGSQLLRDIHPMLERSDKRILAPLSEADRLFMELLSRLVQVNNIYSRAPLDTTLQEDLLAKSKGAKKAPRAKAG